jgi:hypothetical protein
MRWSVGQPSADTGHIVDGETHRITGCVEEHTRHDTAALMRDRITGCSIARYKQVSEILRVPDTDIPSCGSVPMNCPGHVLFYQAANTLHESWRR